MQRRKRAVLLAAAAMMVLIGTNRCPAADSGVVSDESPMAKRVFELQVVVDFYDDLLSCPFSRKTLQEMMRIFRSWGITRVYWTGQSYASGLYDAESNLHLDTNALRTYQEVGEFIPAAAMCAHEQGLEFYVEFKPFDMYFPLLVPHDVRLFKVHNTWRKGIPAVGGFWQMGSLFPEKHPEYLMARNRTGLRNGIERETIGTIKFIKNDDKPTGITKANLRLYTSSDNHHYREYQKPYEYKDAVEERPTMVKGVNLNHPSEKTERVRVITLSNLAVSERYVAVSTHQKAGGPDFGNTYCRLVEAYTDKGEPMPFTYGIPSAGADAWFPPELAEKRFPERGFMFDMGANFANSFNFNVVDAVGYLDSESRLLGLAKGKNRYLTALCPAYPQVREYWLGQIKEFISSGVDGVELRWAAHQDTLEWDAYGYNAPVVAEYRKRYGVSILREDFDRAKWRKLLGEYYTQFLREVRALLAKHGKKMLVDVMPSNNADPSLPQFLNVHLDWEQWFSFADGVSFKWVQPNTEADAMFRRVANRYGIPTYYNVWPQVVYRGWAKEKIVEHLKSVKGVGHQGFMLYESAAFMRAKPDGTLEITYPDIPNVIAPAVRSMH